jgi:Ca2+/Na+ antiporter
MTPSLIGLVGSQITAIAIVSTALALNVNRSARMIKHVDWRRVSDPQGLVHYTRLIMLTVGALISINGIVRCALPVDHEIERLSGIIMIVLLITLALALMILKWRFQDRPSRDGDR